MDLDVRAADALNESATAGCLARLVGRQPPPRPLGRRPHP